MEPVVIRDVQQTQPIKTEGQVETVTDLSGCIRMKRTDEATVTVPLEPSSDGFKLKKRSEGTLLLY